MRHSIRTRMIAMIALPTLVIYVVVIGLMMAHLRPEARSEVEIEMTRLAGNYAARFDGAFREAAAVATVTARFIETAPDLTPDQLFTQLRANVALNPLVYGAAIAFEPGVDRSKISSFCYCYQVGANANDRAIPTVHIASDSLQTLNCPV